MSIQTCVKALHGDHGFSLYSLAHQSEIQDPNFLAHYFNTIVDRAMALAKEKLGER